MDPFIFTRQTAAFVALLCVVELVAFVVFPILSLVFAALGLAMLLLVWFRAGLRTSKWLWLNPVDVPLTEAEGAVAVSAAVFIVAGLLVIGHEGTRFAAGKRDLLTGYVWQFIRPVEFSRPPFETHSTSYSDRDTQQRLKDALAKAGVPFKLEKKDGKEFITWAEEHTRAVEDIVRKLDDRPSPGKRSVSFQTPELQQAYKQWLKKRGIAFEVVRAHDREFVTWKDGTDDLPMEFMKERSAACDGKASAKADGKAPTKGDGKADGKDAKPPC